jgi:hypothetical protein
VQLMRHAPWSRMPMSLPAPHACGVSGWRAAHAGWLWLARPCAMHAESGQGELATPGHGADLRLSQPVTSGAAVALGCAQCQSASQLARPSSLPLGHSTYQTGWYGLKIYIV